MTQARPAVIVLVAGTGTDVGKTWVAARLLDAWRRSGLSVAARKPAQSYAAGTGATDADVLATASGEEPTTVCLPTRSYEIPLAPPMAAAALGLPGPTIADLVAELRWPASAVDVGLVETAGGVRSPQADDGDVLDLVAAVAPDHIVLVADAGLGTINAVRLSVDALIDGGSHGRGPGGTFTRPVSPPLVVLNRFDDSSDLHRRNLAWLRHVDAFDTTESTQPALTTLAARLAPPS